MFAFALKTACCRCQPQIWIFDDYILHSWTRFKRSQTGSSKCRCNWFRCLNSEPLLARNRRLKFKLDFELRLWPQKTLRAWASVLWRHLESTVERDIPSLNRRSKWSSPADRYLKTGNLVWIFETISPRGHYSLARVVKFNYCSDVVSRSAEVWTMFGNLMRPIVKLALVLPPPISRKILSLLFCRHNLKTLFNFSAHVNTVGKAI